MAGSSLQGTLDSQLQSLPSQASIIAEMHYQRGMTDIKQDLQRKICSYQSILKKTYAAAEKEKVAKKTKARGSRDRDHSSKGQSATSTQRRRA